MEELPSIPESHLGQLVRLIEDVKTTLDASTQTTSRLPHVLEFSTPNRLAFHERSNEWLNIKARIDSSLAQLQLSLCKYDSQLRLKIAPIGILPPELLQEIFCHTVQPKDQKEIIKLSHVSTQFRSAVLGLHVLFTEADWGNWEPATLEAWCSRAGTQLLTIKLSVRAVHHISSCISVEETKRDGRHVHMIHEPVQPTRFLNLLRRSRPKWSTVDLTIPRAYDPKLSNSIRALLFRNTLPQLQTLRIRATTRWEVALDAPRLRYLSTKFVVPRWGSLMPQLDTVDITLFGLSGGFDENAFQIGSLSLLGPDLSGNLWEMAPNLEDLTINSQSCDRIHDSVAPTSLPSVKVLRLDATAEGTALAIVQRLKLSDVRTVEISHRGYHGFSKSSMKKLLLAITTHLPSTTPLSWRFRASSILKAAPVALFLVLDAKLVPNLHSMDFMLDMMLDTAGASGERLVNLAKLWTEERRARLRSALIALDRKRKRVSVTIPPVVLSSTKGEDLGAYEDIRLLSMLAC
ncbi:hypothetical protein DL93DRAFT_2229380 [Clavulina sp. PMI_390]|nr:hypothetical protein DL93DRAFT_2229380 [Clavulina sp. PMI_390]